MLFFALTSDRIILVVVTRRESNNLKNKILKLVIFPINNKYQQRHTRVGLQVVQSKFTNLGIFKL
uniref:Uncharacterized protein n=1 Tax=Heterorhabditis bacteriophora TaxID=37862 RepID=A0A1I7WAI8_HETBA